jgi:hypothetical protein
MNVDYFHIVLDVTCKLNHLPNLAGDFLSACFL